jgi:ATP-dependent RNA helicase DeaD
MTVSATPNSTTFHQLGLGEPMLKAIEKVGYEAPTPIQSRAIPPLPAGRDVIGQAQIGTGKTAAFALLMLERLDATQNQVRALVLVPTHELACKWPKRSTPTPATGRGCACCR